MIEALTRENVELKAKCSALEAQQQAYSELTARCSGLVAENEKVVAKNDWYKAELGKK
jgi:hypothetical protein